MKQCAELKMYLLLMIEPPQIWWLWYSLIVGLVTEKRQYYVHN